MHPLCFLAYFSAGTHRFLQHDSSNTVASPITAKRQLREDFSLSLTRKQRNTELLRKVEETEFYKNASAQDAHGESFAKSGAQNDKNCTPSERRSDYFVTLRLWLIRSTEAAILASRKDIQYVVASALRAPLEDISVSVRSYKKGDRRKMEDEAESGNSAFDVRISRLNHITLELVEDVLANGFEQFVWDRLAKLDHSVKGIKILSTPSLSILKRKALVKTAKEFCKKNDLTTMLRCAIAGCAWNGPFDTGACYFQLEEEFQGSCVVGKEEKLYVSSGNHLFMVNDVRECREGCENNDECIAYGFHVFQPLDRRKAICYLYAASSTGSSVKGDGDAESTCYVLRRGQCEPGKGACSEGCLCGKLAACHKGETCDPESAGYDVNNYCRCGTNPACNPGETCEATLQGPDCVAGNPDVTVVSQSSQREPAKLFRRSARRFRLSAEPFRQYDGRSRRFLALLQTDFIVRADGRQWPRNPPFTLLRPQTNKRYGTLLRPLKDERYACEVDFEMQFDQGLDESEREDWRKRVPECLMCAEACRHETACVVYACSASKSVCFTYLERGNTTTKDSLKDGLFFCAKKHVLHIPAKRWAQCKTTAKTLTYSPIEKVSSTNINITLEQCATIVKRDPACNFSFMWQDAERKNPEMDEVAEDGDCGGNVKNLICAAGFTCQKKNNATAACTTTEASHQCHCKRVVENGDCGGNFNNLVCDAGFTCQKKSNATTACTTSEALEQCHCKRDSRPLGDSDQEGYGQSGNDTNVWAPWSSCSKTCGVGLRTRSCTKGARRRTTRRIRKDAVDECKAGMQQEEYCNIDPCPLNSTYSTCACCGTSEGVDGGTSRGHMYITPTYDWEIRNISLRVIFTTHLGEPMADVVGLTAGRMETLCDCMLYCEENIKNGCNGIAWHENVGCQLFTKYRYCQKVTTKVSQRNCDIPGCGRDDGKMRVAFIRDKSDCSARVKCIFSLYANVHKIWYNGTDITDKASDFSSHQQHVNLSFPFRSLEAEEPPPRTQKRFGFEYIEGAVLTITGEAHGDDGMCVSGGFAMLCDAPESSNPFYSFYTRNRSTLAAGNDETPYTMDEQPLPSARHHYTRVKTRNESTFNLTTGPRDDQRAEDVCDENNSKYVAFHVSPVSILGGPCGGTPYHFCPPDMTCVVDQHDAHQSLNEGFCALPKQYCPWLAQGPDKASNKSWHFECVDGTHCAYKSSFPDQGDHTDCCNRHGGRRKCPPEMPYMCARDVSKEYSACTQQSWTCNQYGGLRTDCPRCNDCKMLETEPNDFYCHTIKDLDGNVKTVTYGSKCLARCEGHSDEVGTLERGWCEPNSWGPWDNCESVLCSWNGTDGRQQRNRTYTLIDFAENGRLKKEHDYMTQFDIDGVRPLCSSTQRCVPSLCECNRGRRTLDEYCKFPGMSRCTRCFKGYHLSKARTSNVDEPGGCPSLTWHGHEGTTETPKTIAPPEQCYCVEDLCKCGNGTAKVGLSCTKEGHGKTACESCDAGYHLEYNAQGVASCEINICTCEGRVAVDRGKDCKVHGSVACKCAEGAQWNSINNTCVKKQCTCANGEPDEGALCQLNGAIHRCKEGGCYKGYHFNRENRRCDANIRVCAHNEVEPCDKRFSVSCYDGFKHNGTYCIPEDDGDGCYCKSGIKTTCEGGQTHKHQCSTCHAGYNLVSFSDGTYTSKICSKDACKCEHGEAAIQDNCAEDIIHNCVSCDEKHVLVNTSRSTGNATQKCVKKFILINGPARPPPREACIDASLCSCYWMCGEECGASNRTAVGDTRRNGCVVQVEVPFPKQFQDFLASAPGFERPWSGALMQAISNALNAMELTSVKIALVALHKAPNESSLEPSASFAAKSRSVVIWPPQEPVRALIGNSRRLRQSPPIAFGTYTFYIKIKICVEFDVAMETFPLFDVEMFSQLLEKSISSSSLIASQLAPLFDNFDDPSDAEPTTGTETRISTSLPHGGSESELIVTAVLITLGVVAGVLFIMQVAYQYFIAQKQSRKRKRMYSDFRDDVTGVRSTRWSNEGPRASQDFSFRHCNSDPTPLPLGTRVSISLTSTVIISAGHARSGNNGVPSGNEPTLSDARGVSPTREKSSGSMAAVITTPSVSDRHNRTCFNSAASSSTMDQYTPKTHSIMPGSCARSGRSSAMQLSVGARVRNRSVSPTTMRRHLCAPSLHVPAGNTSDQNFTARRLLAQHIFSQRCANVPRADTPTVPRYPTTMSTHADVKKGMQHLSIVSCATRATSVEIARFRITPAFERHVAVTSRQRTLCMRLLQRIATLMKTNTTFECDLVTKVSQKLAMRSKVDALNAKADHLVKLSGQSRLQKEELLLLRMKMLKLQLGAHRQSLMLRHYNGGSRSPGSRSGAHSASPAGVQRGRRESSRLKILRFLTPKKVTNTWTSTGRLGATSAPCAYRFGGDKAGSTSKPRPLFEKKLAALDHFSLLMLEARQQEMLKCLLKRYAVLYRFHCTLRDSIKQHTVALHRYTEKCENVALELEAIRSYPHVSPRMAMQRKINELKHLLEARGFRYVPRRPDMRGDEDEHRHVPLSERRGRAGAEGELTPNNTVKYKHFGRGRKRGTAAGAPGAFAFETHGRTVKKSGNALADPMSDESWKLFTIEGLFK